MNGRDNKQDNERMSECISKWKYKWLNDDWMNGESINWRLNECVNEWTIWRSWRMSKWIKEWMKEWTKKRTISFTWGLCVSECVALFSVVCNLTCSDSLSCMAQYLACCPVYCVSWCIKRGILCASSGFKSQKVTALLCLFSKTPFNMAQVLAKENMQTTWPELICDCANDMKVGWTDDLHGFSR